MSNTGATGENDSNRPGTGENPENPLLLYNVNRPGAVRGRPSGEPQPPIQPPQGAGGGPPPTGNVFRFGGPAQPPVQQSAPQPAYQAPLGQQQGGGGADVSSQIRDRLRAAFGFDHHHTAGGETRHHNDDWHWTGWDCGRTTKNIIWSTVVAIILFVIFWVFFTATLEVNEVGILRNMITGSVPEEGGVYRGGRHVVWPFQTFVKFPATYTTIAFTGPLAVNTRTGADKSDPDSGGQPITISCSLQFQFDPEYLHDVYVSFGGLGPALVRYRLLARNAVSNTAQRFVPQDFWQDRKRISDTMESVLNNTFISQGAGSKIRFFQILRTDFVTSYEDTITAIQVAEQQKVINEYAQEVAGVRQSIEVMLAQNQARIANITATGEAKARVIIAEAMQEAFRMKQATKAAAYQHLSEQLRLAPSEFSKYLELKSATGTRRGGSVVMGLGSSPLLALSFSRVPATEIGVKYDNILKHVASKPYVESGLYTIGPFAYFVYYPKTVRTIEFSTSDYDVLHARTSDGLPLVLGVAFQYQLLPDETVDLYMELGQDFEKTFTLVANHLATEYATQFSAYQFFNSKEMIARGMMSYLDQHFRKNFHAAIMGLQINEDQLPDEFYDSVLTAANTKQNITRNINLRDAAKVGMKTDRIIAAAQANATVSRAQGQAMKTLQEGQAAAAVLEQYITAETRAFTEVKSSLALNNTELLQYIWYDALQGGGVQPNDDLVGQVLVGVDPSVYLNGGSSAPKAPTPSPATTARVWGSALDNFFNSSKFEDQELNTGSWHKPRTNASKLAVLKRDRVKTTKKCLEDPGVPMTRSGKKRPRRKIKELSSDSDEEEDKPPVKKRSQRLRKIKDEDDDDQPLDEMFGKEKARDFGVDKRFTFSDEEDEDRELSPPQSKRRVLRRGQGVASSGESEDEMLEDDYESDDGGGGRDARFAGDGFDTDIEEVSPEKAAEVPKIEKIIGRRALGRGFEYLCKFAHLSYLHVMWVPDDEMIDLEGDQRSTKMRNFNQKNHRGSREDTPQRHANLKEASFTGSGLINPAYVTVEKILAVRMGDSGATEYLCKWCGLGYAESTWESDTDIETAAGLTERAKGLDELMDRFKGENDTSRAGVMDCSVSSKMRTGATAGFSKSCEAVEDSDDDKEKNAKGYRPIARGWGRPPEKRQLFEFQVQGITWMLMRWEKGIGFILADEMGLGKTIQTSVTLSHIRACLMKNCPTRGGRMPFLFPKFDVLVCSYETLSAELDMFTEFHWCAAVFDEAHRLKSVGSKMRDACSQVPCLSRFLLTGTPIQNNVGEMWSLLNLADPYKWQEDGRESFLETYADMDGKMALKLRSEVAPYMIQRKKADVLAHLIPAKQEVIINVEMTGAQREIYKAVYSKTIQELMNSGSSSTGKDKRVIPSLVNMHMELRKCCNHPFLITGVEEQLTSRLRGDQDAINQLLVSASGKMVFLEKLIDKLLAEGEKVLVFSQFTMQLDIIDDYLRARGVRFERLDGNVSAGERQEAVDSFGRLARFNRPTPSPSPSPSPSEEAVSPSPDDEINEEDNFSSMVFLLSTKAGGVGLNLCAASVAVIFDSDWNPQNDLQAMARCHRIGQSKNVRIYRLITRNTYEERMFAVASRKLALEKAVMNGLEGQSKKSKSGNLLSAQEMDKLLKEGAYAVAEDNTEEEKKFCAEDFDEIIRNRATTIDTEGSAQQQSWGGVSKATFGTSEGVEMPSMDDPDFWTKMAQAGGIDLAQSADIGSDKGPDEEGGTAASTTDTLPRRRGTRGDKEEYKPDSDADSDDDAARSIKGRRRKPRAKAKATPKKKAAAKAKRSSPSTPKGERGKRSPAGGSKRVNATASKNKDDADAKKPAMRPLPKGQRSIAEFFLAKSRNEDTGMAGG
ncbi:choline dehydrogenase 7 [Perkinsus chesapeaki]|uniref:Choline dehydrogenase 7 n=1 Tax=Perkinsus chesapeaki TaxID=330153 RepID=A0A7J6N0V5_PERCH|nr:choline dehydrogenase 7 [Perkinsus chesapeaki]